MTKIEEGVKSIVDYYSSKGKVVRPEHAFSYFIMNTYFKDGIDYDEVHAYLETCLTDGANDGGIDFVIYDDNESKVVIGQSKFTQSLSLEEAKTELIKMSTTLKDYNQQNVGAYDERMITQLINCLSNLDEDTKDNIEYVIFTKANNISEANFINVHGNDDGLPPQTQYRLENGDDIEDFLESSLVQSNLVSEYKIQIDRKSNILSYSNESTKGMIVNISSRSIFDLYYRFHNRGLFDLNIRRYIKNDVVDNKIRNSLENERDSFWFLNNGLTIACENFEQDGNKVAVYNFSIVNGGQTTTLIGKYSGTQTSEFWVLCKIVAPIDNSNFPIFISRIAEASNSQKAIQLRDLKSNSPEMRALQSNLLTVGVFMEIKRGEYRVPNNQFIKNDEYGQLMLSFVLQQPGTSRTNKRFIFEKEDIYNGIFKYKIPTGKEIDFRGFVRDLVNLKVKYKEQCKKLISQGRINSEESDVLNNGEQMLFALFGIIYAIENNDITLAQINQRTSIVKEISMELAPFISNYAGDDLDDKVGKVISILVKRVTSKYKEAYRDRKVKNVTNFLKLDQNYYDMIVSVINLIYEFEEPAVTNFEIFRRNEL